ASVTVPVLVPLIRTDAPGTETLSSDDSTRPETVRSCASASATSSKSRSQPQAAARNFLSGKSSFIIVWKVWLLTIQCCSWTIRVLHPFFALSVLFHLITYRYVLYPNEI